ncbi:YraN family protein [Mycolicibacillus parakoreensis]|uniref:UPF0102 protein MIU77_12470 n=1 Tax=Mycolicibacillus parakoreensis TaxID=1069221 RepID=A0ABY3TVH1_9MYCO|nr:YraN family protein [Mycolicibacillus parakoreensis]MCV7315875.1 YraN family protein [Mycolicibacillus parakoreensis]ULN51708.1 YraN family protein [Mycolicibacillus parakoreensis]
MTTWTPAQLGAFGERLAVQHLSAAGWTVLERNWRCRYGELDIVAVDPRGRALVFVEVKTRTGDGFGGLAESVTAAKVRRLRLLAGQWLAGQPRRYPVLRLDVIGVRIGRRAAPQIYHLRGVG